MKENRQTLAAIGALTLAIAGCQTIPQAGLIYAQKTVVGIELSTGDASTPGAHLKVGYTQDLGTYVPVVVRYGKDESIFPIVGKATVATEGLSPAQRTAITAAVVKAIQEGGGLTDAISIFSSFELGATTATAGLSANIGNVFATGIAAQHISSAYLAVACLEIQKKIDAESDATKKASLQRLFNAACGG